METITSLGLVLSTSMILPSGAVNFGGVRAQAYCMSSWTDLSLSSLFCACTGALPAAATAVASRMPAPTPACLAVLFQHLLLKPAPMGSLAPFELVVFDELLSASLGGKGGITKAGASAIAEDSPAP